MTFRTDRPKTDRPKTDRPKSEKKSDKKPAQADATPDRRHPRGRTETPPDPWRAPIAVEQIPDTGLEREIKANAAELTALADVGGLREVMAAQATLTVTPLRERQFHVTGRVTARIGQTCVVTLEPIESAIDEEIDVIFAPESQIPALASTIDDSVGDDAEVPDPPEPIVNGVIDLGRLASDALFLGIDPYPRKPDVQFAAPVEAIDPDEHPFAALKALKAASEQSGGKKPKRS